MTITATIQKIAIARVARLRDTFAPVHEYRTTLPDAFPHLELSHYAEMQARIERLGFRFLCDLEPVDFNNRHPEWRTFERCLAMNDGTIVAAFHQLHATGRAKAKLLEPTSRPGVTEFSTELTDGAILATHNARTTAQVICPPNHFSFRLRGEPIEDLFISHCGRVDWLLHQRPDAKVVPIVSPDDLIASLNRLQAKRHAYFKSPDFDLDHYINILGRRYTRSVNRAIADAVRKLLAEGAKLAAAAPWLENSD